MSVDQAFDLELTVNTIVSDSMLSFGFPAVILQSRGGVVRGEKAPRVRMPAWSKSEDEFLQANLGILTMAEMAEVLGRSTNAIKIRWTRQGLTAPIRVNGWMTAHRVCQLMGLDSHTVPAWVRLGIMEGKPAVTECRDITLINFEHLKYWATRPEHWPYFKVEKMKPGYLRRLVEKAQARWGDEWLTTPQVAKMHGLKNGRTVLTDIRVNHSLPAMQCYFIGGRDDGNWAYWFVKRSDAEKFRHPRRGDIRVKWITPRADAFMLRMSAEGLESPEIGRMMKRNPKQVCARIRKLKLQSSLQASDLSERRKAQQKAMAKK